MKTHSAENRSEWKKSLALIFSLSLCRFHLYYFSNAVVKENKDTILNIDTRGKNVDKNIMDIEDIDEDEDPLEKAIQTK